MSDKKIDSPAETANIDDENHPPISTNSTEQPIVDVHMHLKSEKNLEDVDNEIVSGKTLHNTDQDGCRKNVPDVEIFGEDLFQLLSKASSSKEGWMKSTKAMQAGHGCVVQVTTQQRNEDGSYSVAEALTYVPNVRIVGDDTGRKLK